jgi:hypothetical protein
MRRGPRADGGSAAQSAGVDGRRLMDRLAPVDAWGETLGLLATSYNLQPDFIETDFLPTMFGLGAWDDRSWSGRIALERKLAGMASATLLQDARCYARRPRSLRVEHRLVTTSARQKLHAKVVLIVHEHAVRMLVGSANLTDPGYRRNREIVTALAATASDPASGALIRQMVEEWPAAIALPSMPGAARVAAMALERLTEWQAPARLPGVEFAWSGGTAPLWERFINAWPTGRRVARLTLVSPFWSEEEGALAPLATLLAALRSRDALASNAEVTLLTEARRGTQGEWLPELPGSFKALSDGRLGVRVTARTVDPNVLAEEVGMRTDVTVLRALHAKTVVAEGDGVALSYVGSANFTRRGWGFLRVPESANVEAGLLLLDQERRGTGLLPATIGDPVLLSGSAPVVLATPVPPVGDQPYPDFLRDLRLAPSSADRDRLALFVDIDAARIAGEWRLTLTEPPTALVDDRAATPDGGIEVAVDDMLLPALLRAHEVDVHWWASERTAPFPINVDLEARIGLPLSPGEGPREEHLLAYYQGRIAWEDLFPPPEDWLAGGRDEDWEAPPPAGVDTTRILSYQVREFVESLTGIRDDLRAASASEVAIRLALAGPVSPLALGRQIAQAVREGRRTPTAGGFELVELAGCLREARTWEVAERLAASWRSEVAGALTEIERLFDAIRDDHPRDLGPASLFARYARAAAGTAPAGRGR